jgi:hypothetical protein
MTLTPFMDSFFWGILKKEYFFHEARCPANYMGYLMEFYESFSKHVHEFPYIIVAILYNLRLWGTSRCEGVFHFVGEVEVVVHELVAIL